MTEKNEKSGVLHTPAQKRRDEKSADDGSVPLGEGSEVDYLDEPEDTRHIAEEKEQRREEQKSKPGIFKK